MTAGLFARAPRLAVLVVAALLATAGLTFAATSTLSAQPTTSPETTAELPPLVVPDVRHQAYVFAKGMLEQGGFAWRVEGAVHGYSANLVASQTPAPGSKLVANGAPTIVLDTVDDGRCGVGIILQTGDGLHWLYCHLSQRDPAVLPGAVLSAGQWVGLVGSTGDATGPHLHLALKTETSYPQDMTWFQEFAGTAFAWQDAPTAQPADPFRSSPVFAVAPSVDVDEEVVEFTTAPSRG